MAEMEHILQEVREFRQENKEQFESIKEDNLKANTRLDTAEGRIEKVEQRTQNVEKVMKAMLKLHIKQENRIMYLESRSRRENLRIYGVPEGAEESKTMVTFVENLLGEGLKLPEVGRDLQIKSAHRSAGPQPPDDAAPRSIIVKFSSFKTTEEILGMAWQGKGFTWQDKHINLDYDYPPRLVKKRREYAEVRKVLKEKGVQFKDLFPARLRVTHEDGTIIYNTIEDATKDLASRGFTVKPISAPETMMETIRQLT